MLLSIEHTKKKKHITKEHGKKLWNVLVMYQNREGINAVASSKHNNSTISIRNKVKGKKYTKSIV